MAATHTLYLSSAYKLPVPISGIGIGANGILNCSVRGRILRICRPGTLEFKNLENTPSIQQGRPISEISDLYITPGGNS